MRLRQLILGLVVVAALVGCKNKSPRRAPANHVPGTPHTDEVLAAWRNAGLVADGFDFAPPPPNTATYCERGRVNGVDTTVCEYGDDKSLDRGVEQVRQDWERLDVHTGVVLRAKRTTMVAVDKERREPSGKTINAMAKVFTKL